jgi:hypothetical protein
MKTTWKIINAATGRKSNDVGIKFLNIDGKLTDHHHMITESLNNYFLTTADKISTNNTNVDHVNNTNIGLVRGSDTYKYLNYLSRAFTTPFPIIKINYTSTKEIENIIKSSKPKNSN